MNTCQHSSTHEREHSCIHVVFTYKGVINGARWVQQHRRSDGGYTERGKNVGGCCFAPCKVLSYIDSSVLILTWILSISHGPWTKRPNAPELCNKRLVDVIQSMADSYGKQWYVCIHVKTGLHVCIVHVLYIHVYSVLASIINCYDTHVSRRWSPTDFGDPLSSAVSHWKVNMSDTLVYLYIHKKTNCIPITCTSVLYVLCCFTRSLACWCYYPSISLTAYPGHR